MVAPRSKADVVGNLVRSHSYHDITGFILTSYTNRESLGSVTMQAQRDVPPDMQCKDKFLVQSAIVAKEIMPKEVTGDMVISHIF